MLKFNVTTAPHIQQSATKKYPSEMDKNAIKLSLLTHIESRKKSLLNRLAAHEQSRVTDIEELRNDRLAHGLLYFL